MNRRELVQAVAAHAGVEPRQVDTILKGTTEVITAVVAKGEPVTISGFAKFVKQQRAARTGRNPATGEPIKIKASKKARITPLKGFKDAVMTPSQAPKLARGVWPPAAKAAPKAAAPKRAAASTTPAAAEKAPAGKAPAKKASRAR
jgi:DNA-binding protein HU-beta